ncbi:MAG: hypothetical protein P8L18_08445 [Verrucomicrobiota bacterium]|nr:hypothetical protein [Verrucomicrobiota bacterium]
MTKGFFNRESIQRRVERFLIDRDLPLLRALVYSRWLKWALLMVLLICLAVPILIIKCWKVTPSGFQPVIKVSLLDTIQAWSLRRGAIKAMAAGQFDDAAHAWRSSIANNPGNVDYMRDYFQFLMTHDQEKSQIRDTIQNGLWLLRITATNRTDLSLLTDTLDFYGLHALNHFLLDAHKDDLDRKLEKTYFKALFHVGDMGGVRERMGYWTETEVSSDAELKLYYSAFLAGWGSPGKVAENLDYLRSACLQSGHQVLAHTLNLRVSRVRIEPAHFMRSLDFLARDGNDRLEHYIQYWNMLIDEGRKAEAMEGLRHNTHRPRNPLEVLAYGALASFLGEDQLAHAFLSTHAPTFYYHPPVWHMYVQLLTRLEKWFELRRAALVLRGNEPVSDAMMALSQYMEARAAHAEKRLGVANEHVANLLEYTFYSPETSLLMASGLGEIGRPGKALALLGPLEAGMRDRYDYWEMLYVLASRNQSRDTLLQSAENLYRLNPDKFAYMNNYAAVLLSERRSPQVAITLTRELMGYGRGLNIAARVNHALALLLNGRLDEAVAYMQKIPLEKVPTEMQTGYHLAWFQIAHRMKDHEAARVHGLKVDMSQLLPGDLAWFQEAWSTL